MLQRDGMMMVEMKVLMMMMMMVMMMIPMKSNTMVMTMATISPLREGISPIDFCLPESFSLSVFSAPQRQRCLSLSPPLTWVFGEENICEGAMAVVGQGGLTTGRRGQGWTRAPGGEPNLMLLSPPPSGYFCLLILYKFLGISLELSIFRNMVS
jgi:hypothetical protein